MNDLVNLGKFISLILRHKNGTNWIKARLSWMEMLMELLGINNSGCFINRTLL